MPTVLLDTMLLVLLTVGTASREYVRTHRRLQHFTAADFDLLIDNASRMSDIIVTPNTLTETSNWVKMIGEPARSHIAATFRHLIGAFEERYVASKEAAEDLEFPRLWLTDAGMLRELANGHLLMTSDFRLYEAALRRGFNALNFNHLRAQ
jgi:hypothetical protein